VTLADAAGVTSRLLGGVAVCLQAPQPGAAAPAAGPDIDFVIRRGTNRAFAALLADHGYSGEEMFNAVHGSHRLIFNDERNVRHIDVFVGSFSMCHVIPIADRPRSPAAHRSAGRAAADETPDRQADRARPARHLQPVLPPRVVADGEPGSRAR